jgi:hypothetical protein
MHGVLVMQAIAPTTLAEHLSKPPSIGLKDMPQPFSSSSDASKTARPTGRAPDRCAEFGFAVSRNRPKRELNGFGVDRRKSTQYWERAVSDLGQTADTLREASPLLRFSSAMRWARDNRAERTDDDGLVDEAAMSGRLAQIETRMGKLAERFDQLEFVIVEQFEPGMTEAGELPSGNLRDRLDRIEEGLGHLRRTPSPPPTWAEATVRDEDVLDAAAVEARLDDIAARLAELAEAGSRDDAAKDALGARLAELTEAGARDDAARDALGARLDEMAARLAELVEAGARDDVARDALGARLDETAARLAELVEAGARDDVARDALGARLDEMAARLAEIAEAGSRDDAARDALGARLDEMAARLAEIAVAGARDDAARDGLGARLDEMAARLAEIAVAGARDDAPGTGSGRASTRWRHGWRSSAKRPGRRTRRGPTRWTLVSTRSTGGSRLSPPKPPRGTRRC